jgi:hypothetical protein
MDESLTSAFTYTYEDAVIKSRFWLGFWPFEKERFLGLGVGRLGIVAIFIVVLISNQAVD